MPLAALEERGEELPRLGLLGAGDVAEPGVPELVEMRDRFWAVPLGR